VKLCASHRKGVAYGSRRFYCPGCPTCERKLAAGTVTVTDPRAPLAFRKRYPQWGTMYRRKEG
jgi:hypothetical protein